MSEQQPSDWRFASPRYWHVWLALGVMRAAAALPPVVQDGIGRGLGRLAYRLMSKRRRISKRNIQLCFPHFDEAEVDRVLRAHFLALGQTVFETGLCWWGSDARLSRLSQPEGLEHMHAALERGKGVLMLSAHFTSLEMGARLLCLYTDLHVMARKANNPLWDRTLKRMRGKHAGKLIARNDVRSLVRSLRNNKAVWFAPDQAPSQNKEVVLAPFFGEPAMTNTAASRLAKMTGAAVVPYFPLRTQDGHYRLLIGPQLHSIPSGDPLADAVQFHHMIEHTAKQAPEQYLWIHRRFKGRPAPHPDPYKGL